MNECQNQKKKFSPLLSPFLGPPFFTATLSFEPHDDGSSTPLWFVGNTKKKREKRGGKIFSPSASLCRFQLLFSLSLFVRERSLTRARAKLLGDREQIAARTMTTRYSKSSTSTRRLRAAREKHPLFLGEEEDERREFKRFFSLEASFPRRTTSREGGKKNKEIKRF